MASGKVRGASVGQPVLSSLLVALPDRSCHSLARSRARLGLMSSRSVNRSLLSLFLAVAWAAWPACHFRRSWIPAASPVLTSASAFFTSALGLFQHRLALRSPLDRSWLLPSHGRVPTRLPANVVSILWAVSLYCSGMAAVLSVSALAWICCNAALKLICRGVSGPYVAAARRCRLGLLLGRWYSAAWAITLHFQVVPQHVRPQFPGHEASGDLAREFSHLHGRLEVAQIDLHLS